MNAGAIAGGGIIAAGAGSRLRLAGRAMPKALVPVCGKPLIEHVIRNFVAAGIPSLTIIFNEQSQECVTWLHTHFPSLHPRIIVKTTASSLESFLEVTKRMEAGRALISTVDAWCPPDVFGAFVEAARGFAPDATVLAMAPPDDDDQPLWASLDDSGRVIRLGGRSGEVVTAGIYLIPESVRRLSPPPGLERLRDFLTWLFRSGQPLFGVTLPRVVDVDRPQDILRAEGLAAESI